MSTGRTIWLDDMTDREALAIAGEFQLIEADASACRTRKLQ
jgi:hypothetical protein